MSVFPMWFYKPEHAREYTVQSKWWELSSLHLRWGVGTTCSLPTGPGSSASLNTKHSISHGVSAVPVLGDWCCCKHMFGPHWNTPPHSWSSHGEEKAFWSLMSTLISCHQPTDDADGLAYPMGHLNAFHGLRALWGPEATNHCWWSLRDYWDGWGFSESPDSCSHLVTWESQS